MAEKGRIRIRKLTDPAFAALGGTWAKLDPPKGKPTAKDPVRKVKFWADLVQVDLGVAKDGTPNTVASIGLCRVERRDTSTDPLEFHAATGEGILPLGADIVLLLAKACASDPPAKKDVLAFGVPGDSVVCLPKGTWHWAPAVKEGDGDPVDVVIILPPETFRKDCTVRELTLGLRV